MNRKVLRTALVGIMAALLVWTGCGSEEPADVLECGEGTELRDGECVLADHDCEEGEVVTSTGQCIEPDQFCEDDTASWDAETGECVTDSEINCGPGTVEDDGVCVADVDSYECGEGTVLVDGVCELDDEVCGPGNEFSDDQCQVTDEACSGGAEFDVAQQECVHLTDLVCGTGTVEQDDQCVPLYTYADGLAEDADIDYLDGAPIEPDEDSNVIFTGRLDTAVSQTFDLEGQEGQWLKVTIYPRGLPSPGFEMTDSFDNWRRAVAPARQAVPSRMVRIPSDDTFSLTVQTALSSDDAGMGDSSWQYVGEVEVLDGPEADEWDVEEGPLQADLTETADNLVEIDAAETDELFLTSALIDEDVVGPTVERWDGDQFEGRWDVEAGERIELDVQDDDELVLHFDAAEFVGPRTGLEISGQLTETLPSGDFYFDEVSAEAGQTLMISHRSDQADPVDVRIFRNDQFQGSRESISAENKSSYDPDEPRREYFWIEETGDYVLEFQNTTDEELTSFVSTSGVEHHQTFEIEDNGPSTFDEQLGGEDLNRGDWKVVYVKTPGAALIEGTADHDGSTSSVRAPDVTLYDLERREVAHEPSDSGNDTDFRFAIPESGRYLLAVQPESDFGPIDNLGVDMSGYLAEYVEPGDSHEKTFEAEGFDILSGTLSMHDGPIPTVRLFNPDQFLLFERETADGVELMEIIPGPGEYTLEFVNAGEEAMIGLDAEIFVTTPFDILSPETSFSHSYGLGGLDENERDMLLFRPETDFIYDLTYMFEEGETGLFRLWDVDEREVLLSEQGEGGINLEGRGIGGGTYVLEFVAQSDIEDYHALFSASDIVFIDEVRDHEPNLEIGPDGTIESTALGVEGCDQILDVSLATEFATTPTGSDVNVYLYPPDLDDPIAIREEDWGGHSTVYPDETEPHESMDPIIGTSGNGVWSIDIENNHSSSWEELDYWSIHLTCTHN